METDASPPEQCATAAVVLGLVSLAVCWWFPFGALAGAVGTVLGIGAWYAGRVAERALVGTFLAASGTGAALLLAWDYWARVFGL